VPCGAICTIYFHPRGERKPFGEHTGEFYFTPWWPSLSYGPHFHEALRVFGRHYADRTRRDLLRTSPRSVDSITLEEYDAGEVELTTRAQVAGLLGAASTIDGSAYDVTDKERTPVRMVLHRRGWKPRVYHLLVTLRGKAKRGRFALLVCQHLGYGGSSAGNATGATADGTRPSVTAIPVPKKYR
jgi:hypothetical protein